MASTPPLPQRTIARPSVASLFLQAVVGENVLSTATGFLVRSEHQVYLVTNRHVVRGRRQDDDAPMHSSAAFPEGLLVHHNVIDKLGAWMAKREPLYATDGKARWLEHPTLGAKVDVVALPLTDISGVAVYDHSLTPPTAVTVGPSEVVSIIGFPFGRSAGGLLGIWVAGTIASEPDIDFDNLPSFLVDSRTREGQSGSPVIAYRSGPYNSGGGLVVSSGPVEQFLGIYSGRINRESDLGIVWKARALYEIVARTPA